MGQVRREERLDHRPRRHSKLGVSSTTGKVVLQARHNWNVLETFAKRMQRECWNDSNDRCSFLFYWLCRWGDRVTGRRALSQAHYRFCPLYGP
jgi:hypothetical protein